MCEILQLKQQSKIVAVLASHCMPLLLIEFLFSLATEECFASSPTTTQCTLHVIYTLARSCLLYIKEIVVSLLTLISLLPVFTNHLLLIKKLIVLLFLLSFLSHSMFFAVVTALT